MELLFDVRGGDFSLLRRSRSASSRLENKLAVDFLSRGMRRGEGCCAGGSEGGSWFRVHVCPITRGRENSGVYSLQ